MAGAIHIFLRFNTTWAEYRRKSNRIRPLRERNTLEERGFYFRGDKAYTVDHILVRRVYVKILSEHMTKFLLCEHFTKFGKVDKAEISGVCTFSSARHGYVEFISAVSAAKALQTRVQYTEHECYTVIVEPYDSWEQPDFSVDYAPPLPDVINEETSVLMLNAYCLEGLLLQMSLSNQIRFCQVHSDIKVMFVRYHSKRMKRLRMVEVQKLTLWELRLLLDMIGEHVQFAYGEWPRNRAITVMRMIIEGCPNLKGVKVDSAQLTLFDIEKFKTVLPSHLATNTSFD